MISRIQAIWNQSPLGKLRIGIAGILITLVCSCICGLALIGRNARPTTTVVAPTVVTAIVEVDPIQAPTAIAMPAPTSTLAPTNTVGPTDTPAPTNTQESTATPVPTEPPQPTATLDPFQSGGLGLSRETWEDRHGKPERTVSSFVFYAGDYSILFLEGKVWHLEQQWNTQNAITPEDARFVGEQLAPADRQFIETYSPEGRPEATVNLYFSASLKERFSPDLFIGGEPGNFVIQYNVHDAGVTRMIIALGNNP